MCVCLCVIACVWYVCGGVVCVCTCVFLGVDTCGVHRSIPGVVPPEPSSTSPGLRLRVYDTTASFLQGLGIEPRVSCLCSGHVID